MESKYLCQCKNCSRVVALEPCAKEEVVKLKEHYAKSWEALYDIWVLTTDSDRWLTDEGLKDVLEEIRKISMQGREV